MNRTILTKLVAVILVLILAMTVIVGAFLVRGVQNYYLESFFTEMQEVFASASVSQDLRSAADAENAPEIMADVIRAYSGRLGINAGSRNFFILDGETAECLDGSDSSLFEGFAVTENILTAMLGEPGYDGNSADDYMDVAVPVSGKSGNYIIYVLDTKETVSALTENLISIIARTIGIGILIASCLAVLLSRTLIQPVLQLTSAAKKVASGDFSTKVENTSKDEIGVLTRTFNDMASQLEQNINAMRDAEQTRKEFVANVSHELRTPITSIKGYAETLEDGIGCFDPETQSQFLGVIINESNRMTNIVQDLLTLSRFDAGSIQFDFKPFSFSSAVESVFQAQQISAGERNHNFTLQLQPDIPDIIGDRNRVEQILVNLVSNAIKYTRDGGTIKMTAGAKDGMAYCSVSDNGVGIPEKDLPHIFERFYRVDKARSREYGGTGLGLSIANEIALRHHGRIAVKSKKGRGTTFTLYLPFGGPNESA